MPVQAAASKHEEVFVYQYESAIMQQPKKILNSEHMGSYAQVGDWHIHYYEMGEGEGTPLLLVHGLGQSLYTWHKVMPELAKKRRVIAIDLPGSGYSSRIEGTEYSIDNTAELIVRFLDTIAVKTCDAIGFSFGAMYLIRSLQLHPRRFGRVVLASPGGLTPEMPFFLRALRSPVLSWLYKNLISPRSIQAILDECFFDQTQINEEMIQQTYQPLKSKEARNALVNMIRNFDENETMQHLRDAGHECLLLWGEDDRWHDPAIGEQFNVSLHRSALIRIRNCGHMIHEEKIDRFMEPVENFLEHGLSQPEEETKESGSYFFG